MIHFLSVETTIAIHDILIESYGGLKGVRDHGLLLSALEMPKASFDGKHLHPTLFDKASAYLYHVAKNHPFIDGNKRTAAALSLTFLELNKVKMKIKMKDFEDLVVGVAEGTISKQQIACFFKDQS